MSEEENYKESYEEKYYREKKKRLKVFIITLIVITVLFWVVSYISKNALDKLDEKLSDDSDVESEVISDSVMASLENQEVQPLSEWESERQDIFNNLTTPEEDCFSVSDCGEGIRIDGYHGTATKIKIPDMIGGKPVVEINLMSNFVDAKVEVIWLPDSVRSVEILNLDTMTAIRIPDGVERYRFYGCDSLVDVRIPKGATAIVEGN